MTRGSSPAAAAAAAAVPGQPPQAAKVGVSATASRWQRAARLAQEQRRLEDASQDGGGDAAKPSGGGAAGADNALSRDEAKQLFGVGFANSAPSILEGLRLPFMRQSVSLSGVRVSVLLRCARGLPPDCRAYAKVACGGTTLKTPVAAVGADAVWHSMLTFDVDDPERAALSFRCKNRRRMAPSNEQLGRATLPLSEVSAHPDRYGEPHRLTLRVDSLARPLPRGEPPRELEVQVFMSTRGQLAAMAARGGAVSVLAATWNVGNALPPPPAELAASWLRGTADGAAHHLVAVAAQECAYARDAARAAKAAAAAAGDASDAATTPDGSAAAAAAAAVMASPLGTGSLRSSQAAAAEGARQAPDTEADEDDEDDEDGDGTTAAASNGQAGAQNGAHKPAGADGSGQQPAAVGRGRSLTGRIAQNFDSTQAWEEHISAALGPRYWLVASRSMFQTRLLVFARMDVAPFVWDVWSGFEATGIGRVGLNKGGVAVSLRLGATRVAFVGCHLAAHQSQCARRNHDVGEIVEELIPPGLGRAGSVTTGPDHVVWLGDLNYRLDWGRQAETLAETPDPADHAEIVGLVRARKFAPLLATDQLAREMAAGRVLPGFREAPIDFPPTFKVAKGVPGLAYGAKRSPAWCDRVLVRSNLPHRHAEVEAYWCCPDVATSDHKPVAAALRVPMVAVPSLSPGEGARRRQLRLYVCSARLGGRDTWAAVAAAVTRRLRAPHHHWLPLSGSPKLRLMLSGPALAWGRKEHAVALDESRLQAGFAAATDADAPGGDDAPAAGPGGEAAAAAATLDASVLRGEASMQLVPSAISSLKDAKLLVRLVLQEGPFHLHTIACGVLPLHDAAEAFSARRFKPAPVAVMLETQQGLRLGDLNVDAQIFGSARTRGLVADAVRRMRLLVATNSGTAAKPSSSSSS